MTKGLNMQNKTCGECRFYNSDYNLCLHWRHEDINEHSPICNYFKPLTNGDVIRQMSNDELMKFKERAWCFYCAYHVDGGGRFMENCNKPAAKTCADGNKEWLNAPAESKESEVSDE